MPDSTSVTSPSARVPSIVASSLKALLQKPRVLCAVIAPGSGMPDTVKASDNVVAQKLLKYSSCDTT